MFKAKVKLIYGYQIIYGLLRILKLIELFGHIHYAYEYRQKLGVVMGNVITCIIP